MNLPRFHHSKNHASPHFSFGQDADQIRPSSRSPLWLDTNLNDSKTLSSSSLFPVVPSGLEEREAAYFGDMTQRKYSLSVTGRDAFCHVQYIS